MRMARRRSKMLPADMAAEKLPTIRTVEPLGRAFRFSTMVALVLAEQSGKDRLTRPTTGGQPFAM